MQVAIVVHTMNGEGRYTEDRTVNLDEPGLELCPALVGDDNSACN